MDAGRDGAMQQRNTLLTPSRTPNAAVGRGFDLGRSFADLAGMWRPNTQASAGADGLSPLNQLRRLPNGSLPFLPGVKLPVSIGRLGDGAEPRSLGRIGSLEVRLAHTVGEVMEAQQLRYRVFYEEMSAVADAVTLMTRRDADAFDPICDHLLVLDHAEPRRAFGRARPRIVGTYRLLRQSIAERHGGFYTEDEYDLEPLLARHRGLNFLELGRSCVLEPYRDKRTVELLWHGVWAYVLQHRIDALIGCASIEGTDPDSIATQLAFLHHHAGAPADWQVDARPERFVAMDRLPREAIDPKQALRALPPLVKGYLRLGAYVGRGAVIDHQFGTTDIFICMPVARISQRYVEHYGANADRFAA
jgi:putative hemolysin